MRKSGPAEYHAPLEWEGPARRRCRPCEQHRDDKENSPPEKQYQWLHERRKDGTMRAGEDDDAEEADGRQHG